MAYIYQITNDINEKIYIGKTESSIKNRFKKHCNDAFRERNEKRPLYAAMRKYGIEHFHIKLIEETNDPEEREKYWIEKLGSFKYGYNATIGGDGKRYADYDLIYSLYNQGNNYKQIHEITHYDDHTIKVALDNHEVTPQERDIRRIQTLYKPVAMVDIKTNKILKIYPSITEAEKENGNTHHIADVCKGTRKSCKGYFWKYI